MPQFEVFKKRMVPLTKVPYVTLQKRGTISFNQAAHAALGSPDAIELLYDPEERVIGVRAVDPSVEHAYPTRGVGGDQGKATRTFLVSGAAFVKFYGIPNDISTRYPAHMEDDILFIDLKQEGTVVTSNRSARTADPKESDPLERPMGPNGIGEFTRPMTPGNASGVYKDEGVLR